MSAYRTARPGTKGGKDHFDWDSVKSDKNRERSRDGKDANSYAKNREYEREIKSTEFRSAKRIEEEALMAALGMKSMPPPAAPPSSSTQPKPVIKREPQSTPVKNEPMTPAVHGDPRNSKRHDQNKKHDNKKKEDRRRRRQLKATASDEEKNDWSENDEEDLMDRDYEAETRSRSSIEPSMATENELDEFLIDLVEKHGLKTVQKALKSKKDKKERKHKRSASSQSSSSSADSSESEEEKKSSKKHKHKKKHSHKESKRHRTRSSSPSSEKRSRSKHN